MSRAGWLSYGGLPAMGVPGGLPPVLAAELAGAAGWMFGSLGCFYLGLRGASAVVVFRRHRVLVPAARGRSGAGPGVNRTG
jgi:hypothetical protein